MYEIDPARLDLALEFKARPFGPHSAELQAVVLAMRGMPISGKHCLIVLKPREQWALARMEGDPLGPRVVPGYVFSSIEEAEWTVFKLRWLALTGHDLDRELEEPARVAPRAVELPDPDVAILGYVDHISAAPGETVAFKVSCHGVERYDAAIVRLTAPATGKDGAGFREEAVSTPVSGSYVGRVQPLRLGSYARMPRELRLPQSFTFDVLAWPTRAGRAAALIGNWSQAPRTGATLCLDEKGAAALRLGDGMEVEEISTGVPLAEREWCRLTASFDRASGTARVSQQPLEGHGFSPAAAARREARIPFAPAAGGEGTLIAAWHGRDGAAAHFNGKLEAPRVFGRALAETELAEIRASTGASDHPDIVATWDFSRDISSGRIVDAGPAGHHGVLVNQPARAMTGHLWDGAARDWQQAPHHYGAIHFHDDDIDDAGWETDFSLTVPPDMASGVYAARLRGGGQETYLPFFVRPGAKKARVAFLAPTATYTVYCNNRARFFSGATELIRGRVLDFDAADLQLLHYPLGLSTYCAHSDGSGVCYGTRLRPVTNFRPKGRLWNFSEDLFVIDWLEREGCGYDVITDDDLHRGGAALLAPYRAVVTGTHPEYATLEMIDALEAYLKQGGRLMYLGGNGFYWRVAYRSGEQGVIEMRRAEDGTRAWDAVPGEYHMGFTGEMGGLWRRQGRPPNMLVGIGFAAQGFDTSTHYRLQPAARDPRAAFIFDGVSGDIVGDFGTSGGGAAGEEIDCFDLAQGSPRHALVLASSESHSPVFQPANDTVLVPHGATGALHNAKLRADMVFFETPNGGAVFSVGSIAYAASLSHNGFDNDIARITGNVLRRFVDPEPFAMPDVK